MLDFIAMPFGYLLDLIYGLVKNYGIAIILFAVIAKLCVLPLNIKAKKGMMGQQRIQPKIKALEKYKSDKARYNQELQKLYKEEGVSATAGCLPTLITLPIMLALYGVIRKPLTVMMHLTEDTIKAVVRSLQEMTDKSGFTQALKDNLVTWVEKIGNGSFKVGDIANHEIEIANNVSKLGDLGNYPGLYEIDFSFLGMNLSVSPQFNTFNLLWLLPVISGLTSMALSLLSSRMQKQIQVGEQNPMANNKMMIYMMPLLSVWIGFSLPAGITVYWIASNLLALVQEYFMSRKFNREILEQRRIEEEKKAEEKKRKLVAAQLKYQGKKGKQGQKQKPGQQGGDDSEQ